MIESEFEKWHRKQLRREDILCEVEEKVSSWHNKE